MTTTTRQQSLINARRACDALTLHCDGVLPLCDNDAEAIICLISEFHRLDTAEQLRTSRAGRPPIPNPSPKTLAQRRYRAKPKPKPKQ
jgi:hypothetical protein